LGHREQPDDDESENEPSTTNATIRDADTVWHEQGGWFDARWHFSSTAIAIRSRWASAPAHLQ
jgi:hypothetical protein